MEGKFFDELKKKIHPYFEKAGGHEFDHTERVYKNAIKISENEQVDLDIIKAAALLHDVARSKDKDKSTCHAEQGAKMTKEILLDTEFPKEKIEAVCHAIRVHRYSKGLKAETKEAEIIQDADRLDALGAITIGRIFSRHGKIGSPMYDPKNPPKDHYDTYGDGSAINHFYEKILKIKPETFKTLIAREIAQNRYEFVKQFVDRFMKEWNGEL